ncbi:hypothetical protein QQ054_32090 [Oscillatoria amoena NRMC-F 0135]|nr:hypothetical protein [Oscillatoria amoena NRMC-F 0135]
MKGLLSILTMLFAFAMSLAIGTMAFGPELAIETGALLFGGSIAIGSIKGVAFDTIVPSTELQASVKWAGKFLKTFISQTLNGLDVFMDNYTNRMVSRHGILMPKFTAYGGLRPLDTSVTKNNVTQRSWSGRTLYVYDNMKIFEIVVDDAVIDSFMSDMHIPGATQIPFAQWLWQKEMEKLASEINDNFYHAVYQAPAAAYDAGSAYTAGQYMKFTDKNYYKCVTNAAIGESPTTHPAKWLQVNATVGFNGWGTIIAAEITATNITPFNTGATDDSNTIEAIDAMYHSLTPAVRARGGVVKVGYDVWDDYIENEKSVYPQVLNQNMGDGKKYIYGSQKKWEIKPATWMGTSRRIIFDVENSNLVAGTNLQKIPGLTNTVPTLHGYDSVSKFLLGSEIADLEVLKVNDQP